MFYFRLLCNRLGEQKKMSFLTNVKEYDIKANIKHFVTIKLNALLPLLNFILGLDNTQKYLKKQILLNVIQRK